MTVHSVRIFGGSTEVAAFIEREQADAYVARKPWKNQDGESEMTVVELDVPARLCAVCEEQAVTSPNPDIDFCRECHYTGRAQARIRAAQIERFTKAFPNATFVGPEHTGGGCFWFAIRFGDDDPFYILTDGEASLPEDGEGHEVPNGGWGYVGVYKDDDEINVLHFDEHAVGNHLVGLRDEQAIILLENAGAKS